MRVLTFDVETTHCNKPNGGTTALPHFGNRLVSIGFKWLGNPVQYLCFHHADRQPSIDAFNIFQDALNLADVVIGQNIKFDLQWIKSCGFTYKGDVYDTMVAEYILAKARRWPLGLASIARKYGGVQKEKDLVEPYIKTGVTFYDIPWHIVEEYGKADVAATEHVAIEQLKIFGITFEELFTSGLPLKKLGPTLQLSLEMINVLADIESQGLKINPDTLQEIKKEYELEMYELELRLESLARNAMGDTPINLASPDDRSMLLYSRKVTDKSLWSQVFNLGHEVRGSTMKPKMRTRMKTSDFKNNVRSLTTIVFKTEGEQCLACLGHGRNRHVNKNGKPSKVLRICKECGGKGVKYKPTGDVAGFKLIPRNAGDTASAGFKTDKTTLEDHIPSLNGAAKDFVESYIRYSALRTYLNTFVEGMENNVDENNFIHPEFMQCVTATGRLSSRNPNFQNMPRGSTFAIRKVVESRFEGGYILEGDYSQLEFRVAGFLAKDEQAYRDVNDGADVHSFTASVIGCNRQEAKAHTFKPLYGGTTGTDAQQRYYRAFKHKYSGVRNWHEELQKEAVKNKQIVLPSGREYAFPGCKWTEWGTATNRTAICNYPVQGFATADLLPTALVRLHKMIAIRNMQSVVCNTVHDSIVLDVHPEEKEACINLLYHCMKALPYETANRYGIEYDMPVDVELKIGQNWLDLEEVIL